MKQMKKMLSIEGIKVIFFPLERKGYASLNQKMIFVNQNLAEEEQKKVILHELGHFSQKDYVQLYRNFVQHSKMEAEANEFMVESLVKEYIEENHLDIDQLNTVKLLESTGLDIKYEYCVRQLLYSYC